MGELSMAHLMARWKGIKTSDNVKFIKKHSFFISILAGVVLGIISGAILRQYNLNDDTVTLIAYPGEIFMRALKLIILPFIICCIIVGSATLDISNNKLIAVRTLLFFFLTTLLNVILGVTLGLVLNPGGSTMTDNSTEPVKHDQAIDLLDGLLDVGRNLVPENLFAATFEQTYTTYTFKEVKLNDTMKQIRKKSLKMRTSTNTLGIIFFSAVFGCILGSMEKQKSQQLVNFFSATCNVLQGMVRFVIGFTPFCVWSIICSKIISVPNLWKTLQQISLFTGISICGFLLYQLVIIQCIYFLIVKKNPFKYYLGTMPALMTAFATASKAATLPSMFQVLEEMKMNSKITQFVLPIGTINLNGSSMYIGFAMVFLAQLAGIQLEVHDIITLICACTLAGMSSAGVPSAAIVMLTMLCSVVNVPTTNIGLLFSVDWLIDRFRTATNALGDCYTVAVVEQLSQNELKEGHQERISFDDHDSQDRGDSSQENTQA